MKEAGNTSSWTSMSRVQRIEAVRDGCNRDLSAARIGMELGVSRNCIIGIARRAGIKLHGGPNQHSGKTHTITSVRSAVCRPHGPVRTVRRGAEKMASVRLSAPVEGPPDMSTRQLETPAVMLMNRTGCAWPVSGSGSLTLFCNAPVPGYVTSFRYCSTHYKMLCQGR